MKHTRSLLAALVLATTITSCSKTTDNSKLDYQKLAEDSNTSQQITSDVGNNVGNEANGGQYSSTVHKTDATTTTYQSQTDTCATVTISTTQGSIFPVTLTIDYAGGCRGLDGRTRTGSLTAVFSGPYTTQGSTVNITPNNYTVDGYKLEGTKKITNIGRVGAVDLVFTDEDINGRITKPDGGVITWQSTRTNTWIQGEGTTGLLGILDDVYSVSGSGSGVTSDGTNYTVNITTPLIKSVICPWVSKGVLSYTANGQQVATLDYGTGTCDANASATFLGSVYNIVIQ